MAESEQYIQLSESFFLTLPFEEGKTSIYGVRPSHMFGNQTTGKIFRDTERSYSRHFKAGFQSLNEEYVREQRDSDSE